ncbi:heat shock 70 kDa protein 4-like [Planococcus citri]|uniref:heat shock 70 kDa protein 4-like n=1 Tax=Planococcus citri TaxID=170843 RepID=UPI0031F967B0
MASMFVIGIDFGNESSYIAVPRAGGIEIISFSNTFSVRATSTPSYVAFSDRNRILGVAAKNQLIPNLKNTIFGFKRLLGKNFDDPAIQHDLRYAPYTTIRCKNGTIGVKVCYLDEEYVFSIQQITAMFFTELKKTAEAALKCEVNQCVISVPSFFDNAERLALLDAATIAGLKVLRIFNETAATALTYGIYRQDLPTPEEPPRNVIFVDFGHSSLQVSACAFTRGKLKMLASTADSQLGGRDIDIILAKSFCEQFKSKYYIEPTKNHRAMLRLLGEVEKLKEQMSANSTKIPLNIKCFMNDIDLHGDLKRADMEELCAGLFERVEQTMLKCLQESKLKKEEIHSIEIVGGSSRVPAIKSLIEKVFGKLPSTTLNQDEAVARGCALQCAMLCPTTSVRDFSITDIQNYLIRVIYDSKTNEDLEVFPKNHPIPFCKNLTFCKREPFELKAVYGHNNKLIGKFFVNDVKPDVEGQNQIIKVNVRISINGIFTVPNATLTEKQEINDHGEPMDVSQPLPGSKSVEKENCKKRTVKTTDFPVEVELFGAYSSNELNDLKEQECKMISTDRQERDRIDARNALVEYVYELRGQLSSSDELGTFVPDKERKKLCEQLDEIETWVYEEGDDCKRQVYSDKLKSLQDYVEPIKKREFEFEVQPQLLEEFCSTLQLTQKAVDQYNAGIKSYSHLEKNEVQRVQESTNSALRWIEDIRNKLNVASRHQNLHITADQIKTEKNKFEQEVTKVFQKPKPQSPPAPPQISTDRQERDRIDARNALEEYVYELRGQLSSSDELATFVPDKERKKLCQQLDEIENWIHEEGDDCKRQVYSDKLKSLQDYDEPIKKRKFEFGVQPQLLEEFSSILQLTQKAVDQYNAGIKSYSHLEKNEVQRVQESTNSALRWIEDIRNKLNVASRHQNLHFTADQIKSEKKKFEQEVIKVFQKPKPQQPPTPPREPSQEEVPKCASESTITHLTASLRKQKYLIRMIDSLELTDNLDAKEAKVQSKH